MSSGNATLNGFNILVVEDNVLIALDVERMFESHGAQVTLRLSVAEALTAMAKTRYDFILSDYAVNGEEIQPMLLLAIRQGIPVAILTGYPPAHVAQSFPDIKVFEKPFRQEDIVAHVRWACRGNSPGGSDPLNEAELN